MAFTRFVLVCGGCGCEDNAGDLVSKSLFREVEAAGIKESVQIVKTGCFGLCARGPIVKVLPENVLYTKVTPEDARDIVAEHLAGGRPVLRLLHAESENTRSAPVPEAVGYQKQLRIVLRNCGVIDPEDIDAYIARDGYHALDRALFDLTPEQIIEELKVSGLRGRGGAGFPTWMKWNLTRQAQADQKYIVCNADEGDPGAYMDRSVLEGDPHSVIEAMIIAGRAVGADHGYIYCRAEYPLAIHRLEVAIEQATALGLLGENILGSGFGFTLEVRLGAGAFVCGEETALLASIEGKRGMPHPRPPFPSNSGLWGKPTVINNVETYANIPVILTRGGAWFARIGTEKSKGTKVFALTGKINNSGLVEVPMGTPLREIVYNIGGGVPNGKRFKAVQTGGPSGGVITADFLDTPIDYENLQALGTIMGSGGMIVMDEDDCMVDFAKFYLGFAVDESCGKCAPCRIGSRQLYDMVDGITRGTAASDVIDKLKTVGHAMQRASLCGLGQNSPNPVLSTIRYFEEEYRQHLDGHRCAAGKCKELVTYTIVAEACIGCSLCARRCPANAISGEKRKPYVINQEACIKCGECFSVCKFSAVARDNVVAPKPEKAHVSA